MSVMQEISSNIKMEALWDVMYIKNWGLKMVIVDKVVFRLDLLLFYLLVNYK
jgi:hypothetical protein